ncbi:MAG: nuclear transport factor 2 family protein [Xanthomonadales bacterium]|nr:nuclear transport factor 2 family protein [Xanthomonadales bacterium]
MKRAAATTALLTLTACASAPTIDLDAEAETLLEADRAFAELSLVSNPKAAFAAYMAPNGMMLPRASQGAIEGLENVVAAFGVEPDPGYELHWQPQFAEVAAAGDLGWTWGQYQVVVDGVQVSTGKYLNVWRRQEDGHWKVRVDIGNQRPADD